MNPVRRLSDWLDAERLARLRRLISPRGLSARMILLTAVFAGVVEVLILAPSAASFH